MKLRPMHDYVQLRPIEAESYTGSIVIPDACRDDAANKGRLIHNWNYLAQGTVIAIGPGAKVSPTRPRQRPDVEIGQTVRYKRQEARELPDGTVLVREASIHFEECGR